MPSDRVLLHLCELECSIFFVVITERASLSGLQLTANRANRRSDAHTQFDIRLVFMNAKIPLGSDVQGTTAACRRFSRVRALPLSDNTSPKGT